MTAIKAKKPFILLSEMESKFNAFDFHDPTAGVPEGFVPIVRKIIADINAMPLRRRLLERELMVDEIVRQFVSEFGTVLDFTEAEIEAAVATIDPPATAVKVRAATVRSASSKAGTTPMKHPGNPSFPSEALTEMFESKWHECAGVRLAVASEKLKSGVESFDLGTSVIGTHKVDIFDSWPVNRNKTNHNLQKPFVIEENELSFVPFNENNPGTPKRRVQVYASNVGLEQLQHLSSSPICIGSVSVGNDVVLDAKDSSVSRKHAEIHLEIGRGWYIVDVGSTQGTALLICDDRGILYRKVLGLKREYCLGHAPGLEEDGLVHIGAIHPDHTSITSWRGESVTRTNVGKRLTVIGIEFGTVVVALQSTRQQIEWRKKEPMMFLTPQRPPVTLPCIDQYLDDFLQRNEYISLMHL